MNINISEGFAYFKISNFFPPLFLSFLPIACAALPLALASKIESLEIYKDIL